MPFTSRSRTFESNHGGSNIRKSFRNTVTDFKRDRDRSGGSGKAAQRPAPPETTNAENFYYLKQMSSKTPMVIIMTDGEEIRGWIEWYDRNCLKVNRVDKPNLLIQKHYIKYMFKQDEL